MSSDQGAGVGGNPGFTEAQEQLKNFWKKTMEDIKNLKPNEFKMQELPLARIKKIMKMDEDVKMISAEAPVLFAKAAEIFINELTLRGWVHAEDNKRRTLQRNDIAMAITKYDQFDFLIDIVPREEIRPAKREDVSVQGSDQQIQYLVQFGQQNAPAQQIQVQGGQVLPHQIQLIQGNNGVILTQPMVEQNQTTQQQQLIQVQASGGGSAQQQAQPMQVFTQVVGSNGDIQQVPIQLTANQLQQIALQMQGKQPGHPIVIQTAATMDQQANATAIDQNGQQFTAQPLFQLPVYNQNGS